jgi:hypothetical protein
MQIHPRFPHRYPFDIVALGMVSKVFALSRACLRIVFSGYVDEALGLSRSIVECATNLRFLTAIPSEQDQRTRDYVKFSMADKAFWAHYALARSRGAKKKEIQAYAKQLGVVPNTKPSRQHWSGDSGGFIWNVMTIDHPLDNTETTELKKARYAVDYYQASTYVHCSSPAVDSYCPDDRSPFRISHSVSVSRTEHSVFWIIATYVHSSIAYVLFGLGLDRPPKLDSLFLKTLQHLAADRSHWPGGPRFRPVLAKRGE